MPSAKVTRARWPAVASTSRAAGMRSSPSGRSEAPGTIVPPSAASPARQPVAADAPAAGASAGGGASTTTPSRGGEIGAAAGSAAAASRARARGGGTCAAEGGEGAAPGNSHITSSLAPFSHSATTCPSSGPTSASIARRQAATEPGIANTGLPTSVNRSVCPDAMPARAPESMAAAPISRKERARNSSPKPGRSR